jgi:probable rRNA maturation factor
MEGGHAQVIEVEVVGPAVPRLPRTEIASFVRKAVAAIRRRGTGFPVTNVAVAFIDDAAMRALNRRYRRMNRTTDVLTFPADSPSSGMLGEIVISIDQARRQARDQRHSIATEVRYLLLHGVIHAFGYDHETDGGEMNTMEIALRPSLGLD